MKILRMLLLFSTPWVLHAEAPLSRIKPQLASPSQKMSLQLNTSICRHILTRTDTRSDVKYRVNIDTQGRSLAPVDLNSYDHIIPDEVTIPVWFDWRRYHNLNAMKFPPQRERGIEASDVFVGELHVKPNGEIDLNGQPLFDKDEAMLREACQKLEDQMGAKVEIKP